MMTALSKGTLARPSGDWRICSFNSEGQFSHRSLSWRKMAGMGGAGGAAGAGVAGWGDIFSGGLSFWLPLFIEPSRKPGGKGGMLA